MRDARERDLLAGACHLQEEDGNPPHMEDFAFDGLAHGQILQHGLRIRFDFRRDSLLHQRADDFHGVLRRQMFRVQNHLVGGRIGPFRVEEIAVEARAVMVDAIDQFLRLADVNPFRFRDTLVAHLRRRHETDANRARNVREQDLRTAPQNHA